MRLANLNAYKLTPATRGTSSWNTQATAIREISPDILALQEVVIDENTTSRDSWDDEAASLIKDLAEQCGLTTSVEASDGHPHGTAMAANWHRPWWTALMWNPDTVELVEGSYRPFGAPDYWHGCTTASFDVGAREPILSAAQVNDGRGGRRYYDTEPYTDMHHDDMESQVRVGTIGTTQLAARRPTEALLRKGYMVDAAAHLGAPWEPTVGRWEDGRGDPDPWGPRRIDLILASRSVAPALTGYQAHLSAAAKEASDHLPVYADFVPSKISGER
ncbi:endonuclease/exonuclease/phosphatase family protein [Streptomyces sp. NPDC005962]|uniref:endonuclease/exonuclease/phosphatase family protein n=1 Tax=Streptomyces sp. NPDC005962 TaxID=3154466 RepID=UPI0033D97B06